MFGLAEAELDIPALLDPTDMAECSKPDRLSILTYLAEFYHKFKNETIGAESPKPCSNPPVEQQNPFNSSVKDGERKDEDRRSSELRRKDSCDSGVSVSPVNSVCL